MGAQGYTHAHGHKDTHMGSWMERGTLAEQPATSMHSAWRSCARGSLLGTNSNLLHVQLIETMAGHGDGVSSSCCTPGAPQSHSHLDLLGSHHTASSDLVVRPKETLREPVLPPAPLLPHPSTTLPWLAGAGHQHSSISRAGPAARGCLAVPRRALHPSAPISQADCSCRCRARR